MIFNDKIMSHHFQTTMYTSYISMAYKEKSEHTNKQIKCILYNLHSLKIEREKKSFIIFLIAYLIFHQILCIY